MGSKDQLHRPLTQASLRLVAEGLPFLNLSPRPSTHISPPLLLYHCYLEAQMPGVRRDGWAPGKVKSKVSDFVPGVCMVHSELRVFIGSNGVGLSGITNRVRQAKTHNKATAANSER